MLEIYTGELYDEATNSFLPEKIYHFEHTLLSISNWEMVFKKPFPFISGLPVDNPAEIVAYIPMMNLDSHFNIDDLTSSDIEKIFAYLNEKPTATTINSSGDGGGRRILTSEVIYAYMANAQVPFSCETWNIHRLLTLLGVIGELNNPNKKKRSAEEVARMQAELNQKRRAEMGTSG